MIDALKTASKTEDSNQNPKKKSIPSTKKGKLSEKTVRNTDKKSNKLCLIHGHCAHDSNECALLTDQAGKMKATYNAHGNHYDKNRFKKAQEARQAGSLKTALKSHMKSSSTKKLKAVVKPEQSDESQHARRFHSHQLRTQ
jgi:hypothetical protein